MPDVYAVGATKFRQYDGTNSAAMVEWIETFPNDTIDNRNVNITSESNGVLVIDWTYKFRGENSVMSQNVTLNEGDWMQDPFTAIPGAVFDATYIVKEVPSP
jgi:uncharacterized membrane protein